MINTEALEILSEMIHLSKCSVITTHINPDGDAVGSALALYHAIKHLGKDADVIIDSTIPQFLTFLPGAENIKQYDPNKHNRLIAKADTIFFLDLNDIKRVRSMENAIAGSQAQRIMIDHHINPQNFCNINIIDMDATSTGELIWRAIDHLKVPLTKEMAIPLYAAILTDTGSFRYDKTTSEIHRIIAQLVDAGANPTDIYEQIYNQNPYNTTKLLGLAIAGMELYYGGKLCIMTVTDDMFKQTQTNDDDIEGFVEKTLMIKGVEAGILITEVRRRNEMRVSFRSKGNIDVRVLATRFGGGGHRSASGARISGTVFADSKKMLITTAESLFK